jgi:hypothetical protein
MKTQPFLLLMGVLLAAAACKSTVANVDDFDQSCEVADDCVAVIDGDICCGCPNAVINKKDKEAYDDALGECSEQCDIGCLDAELQCNDGTCDFVQSSE